MKRSLLILVCFIIVFGIYYKYKQSYKTPKVIIDEDENIEYFSHTSSDNYDDSKFFIYNYLENHSIRIEILKPQVKVFVEILGSQSKQSISMNKAKRMLCEGAVLKVYTRSSRTPVEIARLEDEYYRGLTMNDTLQTRSWVPYTTIRINKGGLRSLKIGMMTSVWRAGNAINTNQQVSSGGVSGVPSIKIHNISETDLYLNHNIHVPPKSVLYYRGEHNLGISLGLELEDRSPGSSYKLFRLTKPITDLYYGVSSDVNLGLYSGLTYAAVDVERSNVDIDWDDYDVSASGIYTLEDGWV